MKASHTPPPHELDPSVRELLREYLDDAISLSEADMGNIQLFDSASGGLRIAAHRGFQEPFLRFFEVVAGCNTACGQAHENGQQIVISDVEHSPIFQGTQGLPVMLEAGALAVQSTPIVASDDTVIGVLSTHFRSPRTPSPAALQQIAAHARQLSRLIELEHAHRRF